MQNIRKISDREHILIRPAMYIGAIDKTEIQDFIITEHSIKYETISVVPGLLKIINEAIDNSIDAAIRCNFKYGTNISIKIDSESVEVKDDGTGLPIKKSGENWMPELAFGHAKAGSNFDAGTAVTIGSFGVGIYLANVWSKKFIAETHDSNNFFKFQAKNNAEGYKFDIKPSKEHGTKVKFYPDLERFKLKEIDETHKNAIYQRLVNLSICYPEINFKFNGKSIKIQNFKKLAQLFHPKAEIYENKNISIAVVPNATDDFKHYSYVNGLKIPDGGTHIDTITGNVVNIIRDKLQRKYKSIKPGDIKNKLTCIVFMRGFPNAKFNSQSKEKITNSIKEFNDFSCIDYSFVNRILRNNEIINPIIDIYKIKQEFENRKALKGIETKKKLKSEKYFRATGEAKYLCICEGFSAYGGLSPVLNNKNVSYYVIQGKIKSAYKINNKEAVENKEIKELYQILNEAFTEKVEGNYYLVSIDGKEIIVNENDSIRLGNEWKPLKELLQEKNLI